MKEVATLTLRQDPDEPRLKVRMYRGEERFYIRVESDHPAIPTSMPMRITPSNFRDAKRESEKFLYLIRGVFRQILGKAPDLRRRSRELIHLRSDKTEPMSGGIGSRSFFFWRVSRHGIWRQLGMFIGRGERGAIGAN